MGRIQRKRLGRGVYHVINRALDRRWILEDDSDREKFLYYLVKFSLHHKVGIYHWSLMANHYHIAVETLDASTLSRLVGNTQSRFSLYYHKRHGGKGPLWQSRFKSVMVQKEGYLGRLGRYIERNALRANTNGVKRPWDYRWCSAKTYVLGVADELVDPARHPFWESMGHDDRNRRESFTRYLLNEEDALEDEEFFRGSSDTIGDDKFRSQITVDSGRLTARKRGHPRSSKTI